MDTNFGNGNNNPNNYNNNCKNNNNKWNKPNKTHFINIPIEDEAFIEAFSNFRNEINCRNLSDFHPELVQKSGKLHMTVAVLTLEDEAIAKVHKIMTELNEEIKKISEGKIMFNFDKYEAMGDQKSARVVYAKMVEDSNYDKLTQIIHLIINALVENEIIDKNKLEDDHIRFDPKINKYTIKLHMTILNVMFLNKILKKQGQDPWRNFNATHILNYMKTQALPSAEITQIHFNIMRENKETEKYELLYPYYL